MSKEFKVTIEDDKGNKKTFTLMKSSPGDPKNLNDFILEAISISENKRILPVYVISRNGSEFEPNIKMKFENYGSPLLGDKLEDLHITY